MTGVSLRSEEEQLVAAKAKELARSRDVSGQTIVDEQYHFDVTIDWLYKPHTISAIIVVVGTLIYFAFNTESQVYDAVTNTKIGIFAAAFCLLMLGLLVFPTGPFIRPHPLFWRFTFGIGVLYQLFLTILLFQKRDDARHLLTYLDPRLNQPLRERTYADQCELTWANVSPNIFDRFFVAHFVGWVIKAMMLRDYALCWAISISWEVIEVAFLHMLPNFAECWWDQWILDVLVMNGLGIYVGHKLCDYLEVRRYEWSGVRDIPALTGKVKRVLMQFTPERWTRVRWEATTSVKRFFALHLVVFFFQLEELNAFFLKAILWIPPEVNLNAYRLAIWTFLGLPIGRQLYAFITDPACQRIGNHTFLGAVLLSTEVLIIVKFGAGMFPHPPSDFQIKFVGAFCALWLVACVLILRRIMTKRAGDHLSTPPIAPVSVAEWPPAQALAHPATASAVVGHSATAGTGGWVSADLLSDASRPVSRAGSRAASPIASPLATPAASPPASPRHAAAAAAAAAALQEFAADAGAADAEEEEAPAPRGRRSLAAAPVPVAKRTRSSSRLSTTPQRASSRNVRG